LQTVSIIGLGFVGLSTAVVFASRSIRVIGVEGKDKTIGSKDNQIMQLNESIKDICRLHRSSKKFVVTDIS
jgi:UDP-N-acetyl-D-mannosaminuronate dehydrogenase